VNGAGETSKNDKGMGNTRARRKNTAKRAPIMPTHHHHVRAHVCTVSIKWEIQTNPYQLVKNMLKQWSLFFDKTKKRRKFAKSANLAHWYFGTVCIVPIGTFESSGDLFDRFRSR